MSEFHEDEKMRATYVEGPEVLEYIIRHDTTVLKWVDSPVNDAQAVDMAKI